MEPLVIVTVFNRAGLTRRTLIWSIGPSSPFSPFTISKSLPLIPLKLVVWRFDCIGWMIFDYVKKTGRDPSEMSMLVLTHAHPDHMGGAPSVQRESGCRVAAHKEDMPWIEDVERQYKERPIGNFHDLVEASVKVDLPIGDGDKLDLGDGKTLEVIHTPGHSNGSVCLLFQEDGALITGDAVPISGAVPIYEDVVLSIQSVRKLREIQDVKVLLTSWDEPHHGDRVYELMDEGLQYFQKIHEVVLKEKARAPDADGTQVAQVQLGDADVQRLAETLTDV